MCGIIGVVGKNKAESLLLEGLKRLEYRGYDSAGIATLVDEKIDKSQTLPNVLIRICKSQQTILNHKKFVNL